MYESNEKELTEEVVNTILRNLIDENEVTYQTFVRLITNTQKAVVQAIAKEQTIKEIQSGAFIKKYRLSAPSTVKSAVTALTDKEIILLESDGSYSVYDRFFAIWLRRQA